MDSAASLLAIEWRGDPAQADGPGSSASAVSSSAAADAGAVGEPTARTGNAGRRARVSLMGGPLLILRCKSSQSPLAPFTAVIRSCLRTFSSGLALFHSETAPFDRTLVMIKLLAVPPFGGIVMSIPKVSPLDRVTSNSFGRCTNSSVDCSSSFLSCAWSAGMLPRRPLIATMWSPGNMIPELSDLFHAWMAPSAKMSMICAVMPSRRSSSTPRGCPFFRGIETVNSPPFKSPGMSAMS
mmetsp:Transcript_75543/g.209918  ORF Transcript_75543/g.209918 Transcript_75543/m.209918 type:complete len:239 (+) Transcript_75543:140-856(+)